MKSKTVIVRDLNGREVHEGDHVWLYDPKRKEPRIYGVLEYDRSVWAHIVNSDGKRYLLCDVLTTFFIDESGNSLSQDIEKIKDPKIDVETI